MKTRTHTILGLTLATVLSALIAIPAQAGEVTLSGASCFPIGSPPGRAFEALVKAVNQRGKGVVQIDLKGGAPAIGSPFTLTQKMAKGAYDIVGCTEAYFGNVLPEAPVLRFSDYTYAELRKNGGLAYMQKLLEAKGINMRPGDGTVSVSAVSSGSWKVLTEVHLVNKSNVKNLH